MRLTVGSFFDWLGRSPQRRQGQSPNDHELIVRKVDNEYNRVTLDGQVNGQLKAGQLKPGQPPVDDPSVGKEQRGPQTPASPCTKKDRRRLEDMADRLAVEHKVPFLRLSEAMYPGMSYITPTALVESGVTKYTVAHIVGLVESGVIPASRIAGAILLGPQAVEKLLEYEQEDPERRSELPGHTACAARPWTQSTRRSRRPKPVDDQLLGRGSMERAGIVFGASASSFPAQVAVKLAHVPFERVPEGIDAGTPYITPTALVESDVTKYTLAHILRLIKRGVIPATRMAGAILLGREAVHTLLAYEHGNAERILRVGGRPPGPLKKHPSHNSADG